MINRRSVLSSVCGSTAGMHCVCPSCTGYISLLHLSFECSDWQLHNSLLRRFTKQYTVDWLNCSPQIIINHDWLSSEANLFENFARCRYSSLAGHSALELKSWKRSLVLQTLTSWRPIFMVQITSWTMQLAASTVAQMWHELESAGPFSA